MKTSKQAKSLRINQTWAEKLLWKRLRNRKIAGFKFRRQYPEGPYILDFYCPELHYAIELDGREHGEEVTHTHDRRKDIYLAQRRIFVKRVWNFQLRENEHGKNPHPYPLPVRRNGQGEGKEKYYKTPEIPHQEYSCRMVTCSIIEYRSLFPTTFGTLLKFGIIADQDRLLYGMMIGCVG